MTNQDRIRLALAMGSIVKVPRSLPYPNGLAFQKPNGDVRPIPDPEHDANDDHAVLEWMREQPFWGDDRLEYWMHQPVRGYQIGDYARAALKVIDDD